MVDGVSAHCLKLGTACRLLCQPVGPSAAKTCWTYRLVRIDHHPIVGGTLCHVQIVVYHPLRRVVFRPWYHLSTISCLYGVVAIVYHKLQSAVELYIIVGCIGSRLVVHDKLHAL